MNYNKCIKQLNKLVYKVDNILWKINGNIA